MIDRARIWKGSLNEKALDPQSHRVVGLCDATLSIGGRAAGVAFSPDDELEIARALDAAGVDRIEVGGDTLAAELLVTALPRAEIWGRTAAGPAGVEALARAGVRAVVIACPVTGAQSTAADQARLPMLERVREVVSHASGAGLKVAFEGVDSTRAELDQYRRACETAVEAGAVEVVVADTAGIATPEAAAYLVGQTVDWLGGETPVQWHGHDDFGLATAAAVAAVQAGATWVRGTVDGMGERAGSADLIELALALEGLYGIPTRLDLTHARSLSRLVRERAATTLPPWKPVTGDALFERVVGEAAEPDDVGAFEPYASDLVENPCAPRTGIAEGPRVH